MQRSPPDLILLDIVMPDIDGYEICRRLRAAEATREMPIMFLSSLEDVKDKARGFEVGGNDYLTKPFEMLEVKARVRSLLKAKAYAEAVKAAAERDLRIAREIQMGLLPANIAAQIQGTGLDVHAVLEPARQVGGDLFEVLRLGSDRVLVAMGDVSGKGIPAALFMAVAMTLLRSLARQGNVPLGDPASAQRRIAGTEPARHVRDASVHGVRSRGGLASRARVQDTTPRSESRRAGAAASLHVLWTRARVDARRGRSSARHWSSRAAIHSCFSPTASARRSTPMRSYLARTVCWHTSKDFTGRTARETTMGVVEAVRRHAAGAQQSDDITVVSVHYSGTGSGGVRAHDPVTQDRS